MLWGLRPNIDMKTFIIVSLVDISIVSLVDGIIVLLIDIVCGMGRGVVDSIAATHYM